MATSKKIRMTVLLIGLLILLTIPVYFIWWRLPVAINRYSDIKLGNELINKINHYKKGYGLPETNDWRTLIKLGFKQREYLIIPYYNKINDTTFELLYLEGIDGPYLQWNSNDKKWKNAMPTHFRNSHLEEDVVSLIEETKLYQYEAKLIDSLSSGKRGLDMIVTLNDTSKNIYLVKVCEDNENSLVTYFNFFIDANKMKILNPTGKLDGQ